MVALSSALLGLATVLQAPQPPAAATEAYPFAAPLPSCVLQRYDWARHVVMPPNAARRSLDPASPRGSQVHKFGTDNRHHGQDAAATAFVDTFLADAIPLTTDAHTVLFGALLALEAWPNGFAIDLGAGVGRSSNLIAAVFSRNVVLALDTYAGLPFLWRRTDTGDFPIGTFAPRSTAGGDRQPPFPTLDNVLAVKGLFIDTLPKILPAMAGIPLALVHVDSDVYASAIDGLTPLLPLLRVGTVLIFDEFYNFAGWEDGEYRAFLELIQGRGFGVRAVAYNAYHQQVVLQITQLP
ncbi:MAG: TylF/MycF family methyltransferase [Puniceicoccales bacterium]|jgi:hypothetical protein|nr:TylF/MycF family methyltransferase [Puniceicoccales bacterium]